MGVGTYNLSMISNYRYQFKQKHKREWIGTDEQLLEIIKNVGVLSSGEETDQAVLEEMEEVR